VWGVKIGVLPAKHLRPSLNQAVLSDPVRPGATSAKSRLRKLRKFSAAMRVIRTSQAYAAAPLVHSRPAAEPG
jgi:hypothetical protein